MKRVAALGIATQTRHLQVPHIPPGTLVQGLVDVHVVGLLLAVFRPIGGHTHPLRRGATRGLDLPTLLREADLHRLPELAVLDAVLSVEIVEVETTDVTQNLVDALIAPVVG